MIGQVWKGFPTRSGCGITFSIRLNLLSQTSSFFGGRHCSYHEVSFKSVGSPEDVLAFQVNPSESDHQLPSGLTDVEKMTMPFIRVQMCHSAWNPADVNTVQGKYPSSYPVGQEDPSRLLRNSRYFPGYTVAGSEGWGRITDVITAGTTTSTFIPFPLRKNDWVTLGHPGLGTMRSSMWIPASMIIPVVRGEELHQQLGGRASGIFQVGGTALRMLSDFVSLRPGDIVIQNAGNSAVGFVLSQLVKALFPGVAIVSIIRRNNKSKDDYEALVHYLTDFGRCDRVVAEEDLETNDMLKAFQASLTELGERPPILAINAVGGSSSTKLLQLLGQAGIHITYGGMSLKPVTVATTNLIFKNHSLQGYWHSRWMIQHSIEERLKMIEVLVDLVLAGRLNCPATTVFPLSSISEALAFEKRQSGEAIRSKVIFDCGQ